MRCFSEMFPKHDPHNWRKCILLMGRPRVKNSPRSGSTTADALMKKRQKDLKNRPNLREIASAANVSVATVSRVLNGNNRVHPSVQKLVLDAAAKLNVDLSQRSKTKVLAFVLGNRAVLHVFHSRILQGAETCCATHGWDMVFLSFNYSPGVDAKELHLPRVVQRRDIARAVILAGTNYSNLMDVLDQKGISYALLGNNFFGEPQTCGRDVVFSDNIQAGLEMTRYLIGLGHRDIWFVGSVRLPWFSRYFEGYRRAMDEAGLPPCQGNLDPNDETQTGFMNTKAIVASGKPVTAILAGNDQIAHGVYKALADCGLKIPDDVSVAGCDDTVGSWLNPGLTTTRQFPEELGRQLVELVLKRIANPGIAPQFVTIPTELVKRESCRPVVAVQETGPEELNVRRLEQSAGMNKLFTPQSASSAIDLDPLPLKVVDPV
jgi:DNA-binding LacI/PurR family transcriptional regulator